MIRMLNRGNPDGTQLAMVPSVDMPWHGLLEQSYGAGTSTLHTAYGDVSPIPPRVRLPDTGTAHLLQVPGLPEPTTPLALEAMMGSLQNYALFPAGLLPRGWGDDIAWVYVDEDGTPWSVRLNISTVRIAETSPGSGVWVKAVTADSSHSNGGWWGITKSHYSMDFSGTLTRFGLLNRSLSPSPAAPAQVFARPPDSGSPPVPTIAEADVVGSTGLGSYDGSTYYGIPTGWAIMLDAITPQGDKAILSVSLPDGGSGYAGGRIYHRPVAFLEVSLSGVPPAATLTVSVLRDADATLGNRSIAGTVLGRIIGMQYNSSGTPIECTVDAGLSTPSGFAVRMTFGGHTIAHPLTANAHWAGTGPWPTGNLSVDDVLVGLAFINDGFDFNFGFDAPPDPGHSLQFVRYNAQCYGIKLDQLEDSGSAINVTPSYLGVLTPQSVSTSTLSGATLSWSGTTVLNIPDPHFCAWHPITGSLSRSVGTRLGWV